MYLSEEQIEKRLPSEGDLENLFDKLWPICRSISGNGLRESFALLHEIFPAELIEIPTGTKVFDWEIPKEWNIRQAYILDSQGRKVVDFRDNNLHVVNYSIPVHKRLTLEELQQHLHSLPELPQAIPYITSYYSPNWGFCMSHTQRLELREDMYEVFIDSDHTDGSVTLGHKYLPSTVGSEKEFLLSTYLCHPSMANNELSGPIVTTFLYKILSSLPERKFNYRFICVPETIGSIAYLAKFGEELKQNCIGGLVVTCVGDAHAVNYKKSRRGNTRIDRTAENVISTCNLSNKIIKDFFPFGSDERQYCSPGFNLPVGSITRTMYGEYKEYHTSLDSKGFISFKALRDSIGLFLKVLFTFEFNEKYENQSPYCEPMLGKRNLYSNVGGKRLTNLGSKAYLNLLAYSDGTNDLVEIANRMGISAYELIPYVKDLQQVNLLK